MKKLFKLLLILLITGVTIGVMTVAGFYLYLKPQLPDVETLRDIELQTPMQIYTRDGKLISSFGVERREPVSLDEMPLQLREAVLATEDSRFYSHYGFDPIGIARAVVVALKSGGATEGASTVTQQLARNFFLSNDRKLIRKIKELFLAVEIEQAFTKEEILELYLNKIFLGQSSYGVAAASFTYFGKRLDELTLGEMAVIAGLPKSPSRMNPVYSIQRAKDRRRIVLLRMLDENYITKEEFDIANAEELDGKKFGIKSEISAQYVAEMARLWAIEKYGKDVESSGIKIYTTIDSKLQNAATESAIGNLYRYDERHGYRGASEIAWAPTDTPMTEEQMIDYLSGSDEIDDVDTAEHKSRDVRVYGLMRPAIVTAVGEKDATVYIKNRGEHKIEWDGLSWARPFKSDRYQGHAPKKAADILKVGEQIWVRPMNTIVEIPTEETENTLTETDLAVTTSQEDKEQATSTPEAKPVATGEDLLTTAIDEPWKLTQIPDATTAFIALDHDDGSILALVGGFNYFHDNFNTATMSIRQAGSSIKPFIYAAAIERGLTLGSIINDMPISEDDGSNGVWRPKNSPNTYNGPTTVRQGFGQSKNVMAVRALRYAGLDNIIKYLPHFGFNPKDIPPAESLALGSGSITPLHMAQGISSFANGGYKIESNFIDHIDNAYDQRILVSNPVKVCNENCPEITHEIDPFSDISEQDNTEERYVDINKDATDIEVPDPRYAEPIITPQTAFLVRQLMYSNVWGGSGWSGTGWRAKALGRRDVGGKTGTTNDSVDAWYNGFGPGIAASVWIGFSEGNRPLGRTGWNANLKGQWNGSESGGTTSQPAWVDFMKVALKDKPKVKEAIPSGIVTARINAKTGLLTRSGGIVEYFKSGTQPTEYPESFDTDNIIYGDGSDGDGGLF